MAETGRPSSYSEDYCAQVLGWGEDGKSITWMAAQLDVSRDTIYEWAKVHAEFSDALARARAKAQAKWEDMGESGLYMKEFQGATWVKSMAARFPDDWREKSETTLSGTGKGGAIIVATDHDEAL